MQCHGGTSGVLIIVESKFLSSSMTKKPNRHLLHPPRSIIDGQNHHHHDPAAMTSPSWGLWMATSLRGGGSGGSSSTSTTTATTSKKKKSSSKNKSKKSKNKSKISTDPSPTTEVKEEKKEEVEEEAVVEEEEEEDETAATTDSTTTTSTTTTTTSSKAQLSKAMKEKDAADALGDAIRYVNIYVCTGHIQTGSAWLCCFSCFDFCLVQDFMFTLIACLETISICYPMNLYANTHLCIYIYRDRADLLRSEDPLLHSIDMSVQSLGQALGTSDQQQQLRREGGGVEAAPSSVIAQYFLKSHGGVHLVQSVCSLLSTMAGVAAWILYTSSSRTAPPTSVGFTYSLFQRTFLFAMLKHVSGLIAAASVAAQAIPSIGLSQARQWMERIVKDPVSQYVFFNALMMVWFPSKKRIIDGTCWWWNIKSPLLPLVMLGPILVREVISNMWVLSDVLVLWNVGSPEGVKAIEMILKVSNAAVNAIMSLLVTPDVWRKADSAQRQLILSKVVSKISLVLEVAIGLLMVMDAVMGVLGSAFLSGSKRPPFVENVIRLVCVRLYIHFLWIRKPAIESVVTQIRGGASQFPFYILDALYDPAKAMGLQRPIPKSTKIEEWPWYDQLALAMGLIDE